MGTIAERADDRERAREQPDRRVPHAELGLERRRERAQGGSVGAIEREHRGERDDGDAVLAVAEHRLGASSD